MNVGLSEIWNRGDAITHTIALLLIVMSVLSWSVIFYKGVRLARLKQLSTMVERRFWGADSIDAAQVSLGRPHAGNPYWALVNAARDAQDSHQDSHLEEVLSHDEWLRRCLNIAYDEHHARLKSGLGVLASIGSTAPFIGLFGTVWGIYHALLAISVAGQSSLAQVAGPVGESLVMTAFGLFVAIPAVLGYNAIARGNSGLSHQLQRFRHDLHAYFMSGERHRPAGKRTAPASASTVAVVPMARGH
ncbi:biopolymer transporter [Burkholderia territorii]|uniref:MotA/TolQ/ExbB proton channel family protein n=1 Tax=Burkholderia territorii TaxID=1503055 RepID=UPI000751F6D6|nr:MotA/TolQ/ExbB proton channel family protein [Burkholderia territorii]KVT78869.1 biopolymer transporter [Burkholderia territorii]